MTRANRLSLNPSERAARKRAAEERGHKATRARPVAKFLQNVGHCGVVGMKGSDSAYFMEGVAISLHRNNESGILRLPAQGNIQGEGQDAGSAQKTLQSISELRRLHQGRGLIVFEGVKFSGQNGYGTEIVANRIVEFISKRQLKLQANDGPNEYNPMILALGEGLPSDLLTSADHKYNAHEGVVGLLATRFALLDSHELTTMIEPLEDPRG